MIYFDATFFVRLYVDEPGFEKIRSLVQQIVAVRSSILGKMETEAALHRQLREGRFSTRLFHEANTQFAQDCADQFIEWLPLTPAVVERVRGTFAHLPATTFLRTGDAIHLATASEAGFKEIYSNDRHLLAAATLFKLKGINPLVK
jgi:predicted nucleic acid-binding protein